MKCSGISLALVVALLFVFFFLISSPVYSEKVLTDEEWTHFLNERESFKDRLKTQDENYLKTLDQLEKEHQNDLTQLENKYNQKLALLRIESEIRTDSLTKLKKETAWNNVKWFLAGLGVGFAGGEAVGIKIGITLQQ